MPTSTISGRFTISAFCQQTYHSAAHIAHGVICHTSLSRKKSYHGINTSNAAVFERKVWSECRNGEERLTFGVVTLFIGSQKQRTKNASVTSNNLGQNKKEQLTSFPPKAMTKAGRSNLNAPFWHH